MRRLRKTLVLARAAFLITAAGLATGCAAAERSTPFPAASPDAITVDTVAVPLNSEDPSQTAIGDFVYAGGLDDDPKGDKGEATQHYVRDAVEATLAGKEVMTKESKPYGCSIKRVKA